MFDKTCWECGLTGHEIKDCYVHKSLKEIRKEDAGNWAEENLAQLKCVYCSNNLKRVHGHLPSLDLKCDTHIFEVKSKCLSVKHIPQYIKINAGEYKMLKHRILYEKLSLILLLYGVNERTNSRYIRDIRIISNDMLKIGVYSGNNNRIISGMHGKDKVITNTQIIENTICILKNKNKSIIVIPNLFTSSCRISI